MARNKCSLVVDTAGEVLNIGVMNGAEVLAQHQETVWRDMAARLQPTLQDVLARAKISFQDLDVLYVNLGPGSFTSIRIGLAAIKALSFALAIPAYGVSGLEAIGQPFLNQGQVVGVWLKAVGADVYFQYFNADGSPLTQPQSAPAGVALKACPREALLVGNVPFSDMDLPKQVATQRVQVATVEAIKKLATNQQEQGATQTQASLQPLYVRPLTYKKIVG